METLRELDIVRGVPAQRRPLALRSKVSNGMPTLEVRFSPFNRWYEVNSLWEGNFLERTTPGAFSKTMNDARSATVMPVKMLYDHGQDPHIGNKPLAVVEDLREEDDSAVASGTLFDTSYVRDLLPGLEGGVYGSSFRFRVIQDAWNDEPGRSDWNPGGIPERTITEVRLFEQGPVTFPASPTASAGVRSISLTDAYYDFMRTREPERVSQLSERARSIRTMMRTAVPMGTVAEVAARAGQSEPVNHSGIVADQKRRREILYPYLRNQT